MGYHLVDPDGLERWDDRPTDVRSLSAAARYYYHDEQVEVFCVLTGDLHVETPEGERVVGRDQALFVDPGSP